MGAPTLTVPEENERGCVERAGDEGPGCLCCTTALMQIVGRKYALRLFFPHVYRDGTLTAAVD